MQNAEIYIIYITFQGVDRYSFLLLLIIILIFIIFYIGTYICILLLFLLFGGYFDKILFRISINTRARFYGGAAVQSFNTSRPPDRGSLPLTRVLCASILWRYSSLFFFAASLYKTLLCSG